MSVLDVGSGKVLLFPEYNFLHNKFPNSNQVQRPNGFIEVQFLFPKINGLEAINECLTVCQKISHEPFMCAIKMHRADDYMLSFSGDGYSFNVDIPLRKLGLSNAKIIVKVLFDLAIKYKAKIHLAKDELLTQELFQQIYPRYKDYLKIKRIHDPILLFSSDLYKRLLKPN